MKDILHRTTTYMSNKIHANFSLQRIAFYYGGVLEDLLRHSNLR